MPFVKAADDPAFVIPCTAKTCIPPPVVVPGLCEKIVDTGLAISASRIQIFIVSTDAAFTQDTTDVYVPELLSSVGAVVAVLPVLPATITINSPAFGVAVTEWFPEVVLNCDPNDRTVATGQFNDSSVKLWHWIEFAAFAVPQVAVNDSAVSVVRSAVTATGVVPPVDPEAIGAGWP